MEISTEERLAAIERFLQRLVLMIEVEPAFTAEKLHAWIEACLAAEDRHGVAEPHARAADVLLMSKVLETSADTKPQQDALDAAEAALRRLQRPSPPRTPPSD